MNILYECCHCNTWVIIYSSISQRVNKYQCCLQAKHHQSGPPVLSPFSVFQNVGILWELKFNTMGVLLHFILVASVPSKPGQYLSQAVLFQARNGNSLSIRTGKSNSMDFIFIQDL